MHIFSFFLFNKACWLAGHFNKVCSATSVPAPALPVQPGRAYHFHSWVTAPLSILLERSARHATQSGPKILIKFLIPICVRACCSSTGPEKVHLCSYWTGYVWCTKGWERDEIKAKQESPEKWAWLHISQALTAPHHLPNTKFSRNSSPPISLPNKALNLTILIKYYLNTVELSPKIQ